MKILAFAGSLRKGSFNRLLIDNAVKLAPEGVEIEHFLLDGLPNFSEDLEQDPPQVVKDLKRKAQEADGILVVTPEYNYSYSSVTKSALDWGSRPYGDSAWTKKPFALMSASPGYMGGSRAQYHLRQVLGYFEAKQLYFPEVFVSSAHKKFDEAGNLTDEMTIESVKKQLVAFAELIRG
jgi:chromate reductase